MAVERTRKTRGRTEPAESPLGGRFERDARDLSITKLIIADSLRRERLALGLQQKHLALTVGVTASTLSRWEDGSSPLLPSLEKLRELAVALGVSTDTLLGLSLPKGATAVSADEARLLASIRSLSKQDRAYVDDMLLLLRLRPAGRVS